MKISELLNISKNDDSSGDNTTVLSEMAIKLTDIQTSGRKISIQIRTNNTSGARVGQGEHQPPHIHVVNYNARLDVPIEIETGKPLTNNHHISGKLSKEENYEIDWFLQYYGAKGLIDIFNKAMKGEDPSPLFDTLRKEKDAEHRNKNK